MSRSDPILVTGAHGCVGAWTVRDLASRGEGVLALDLNPGWGRMEWLVEAPLRERIVTIQGDVTDAVAMRDLFRVHQPRGVIHLAGLLGPACRADPILGARVNVLGSVHLFEAALEAGTPSFVYASTVVVFGPAELYPPGPLADDARPAPTNHYGAYKAAVELIARAYWEDKGFGSVGLRPGVVYGPGRDQGTTADPTTVLEQVARGRPATIRFSGPMDLQFAPDVAGAFADRALEPSRGSPVYNLRGTVVSVEDYVHLVEELMPEAKGRIAIEGGPLPFPSEMVGAGPAPGGRADHCTPLKVGLSQTIEHFRRVAATAPSNV